MSKRYIPYLLSGASFAISCYALYQSTQSTQPKQQPRFKQVNSKQASIDNNTQSSNEDVCGTASLSRIMLPDDANSSGNVHGGTILKMIGHVGWLSATRFINRNINENDDECEYRGVLVRMEEMNFKLPMHIGEICICNARVTFTSNQSLGVQVTVIAENAITGSNRITNSARMWFVGLRMPKIVSSSHEFMRKDVIKMPQLKYYRDNEYEIGKERYLKQKMCRNKDEHLNILKAVDLNEWTDRLLSKDNFDKERIGSTVFKLAQVTLPSHCFGTQTRIINGGYIMKLMDNVAGCTAHSWCHSRVVTIHINAINFHAPINAGNVCHCYGRIIFTSKRSMEIYVLAFAHCKEEENINDNQQDIIYKMLGHHRLKLVCSAFFTFVALNADDPPKAVDVPLFTPYSSFEKMVHEQANLRYKERKNARKRNINNNINKLKYKPTVIVGPSGVGKGTLLKALKNRFPNRLSVAVSHTTRTPRNGDIDGMDYYFVSKQQFENEIKENKFIEYANVYGNLYGTSKKSVQNVINEKKICLLEIDFIGAKSIKKSSIDANYLFITVKGEHKTCKQRIEARKTETKQQIDKRVKDGKKEFDFFNNNKHFFHASISNDDLTQSSKEIINLFLKWYDCLN